MSSLSLDRENLVQHRAEQWRPPLHSAGKGAGARLIQTVSRFLDLQLGSIWRDLSRVLPEVRGVVVDVGCGAQPFRTLFDSSVCYIGVDTEDAEAHFGYRTSDTRYYPGGRLPIEDGSSDFVLCTETLEHIVRPLAFLCELGRCLKPGGQLLLTVPFAARWHFVPYDYWRFTPPTLAHLLTEAGFRDARVYARGDSLTVACYKVMGCLLPLLLAGTANPVTLIVRRLVGLALSPLLALCAIGANLSLAAGAQGEDCLGYTVLAVWPGTGNDARPTPQRGLSGAMHG